jgi:hypothetical protein
MQEQVLVLEREEELAAQQAAVLVAVPPQQEVVRFSLLQSFQEGCQLSHQEWCCHCLHQKAVGFVVAHLVRLYPELFPLDVWNHIEERAIHQTKLCPSRTSGLIYP